MPPAAFALREEAPALAASCAEPLLAASALLALASTSLFSSLAALPPSEFAAGPEFAPEIPPLSACARSSLAAPFAGLSPSPLGAVAAATCSGSAGGVTFGAGAVVSWLCVHAAALPTQRLAVSRPTVAPSAKKSAATKIPSPAARHPPVRRAGCAHTASLSGAAANIEYSVKRKSCAGGSATSTPAVSLCVSALSLSGGVVIFARAL